MQAVGWGVKAQTHIFAGLVIVVICTEKVGSSTAGVDFIRVIEFAL